MHSLALIFTLAGLIIDCASDKLLSCYIVTDNLQANPPVHAIDPFLCTHLLVIGSCFLDSNATIQFPSSQFIQQFTKLKEINKKLKVVITLTPQNERMSQLVLNHTLMDTMLQKVLVYLQTNNLDGFDYDWEFPVWSPNAKLTDYNGLSTLLQKSYDKLHSSSPKQYLLFVTVAAPYNIVDSGYDAAALNRYADYVQIMNYDFHSYTKWMPFTGLNAPLRAEPYEVSVLGRMNSDYSTKHWLDKGILPSKLVFGLPTYGRGFSLLNPEHHSLYAVATGPSSYGENTDYSLMCKLVRNVGVNYVWSTQAASPYLYFGDQWIGFEDPRSMRAKTAYANQLGLGGVMVFALHADDYSGTCDHLSTYPLIRAVKQELGSSSD